jgi:hypothetical protein
LNHKLLVVTEISEHRADGVTVVEAQWSTTFHGGGGADVNATEKRLKVEEIGISLSWMRH